MAASGLPKCGAPVAEHTSSTGTVPGVPGVTDNGQIVVEVAGAVVEVVGAAAVIDVGAADAAVLGVVVGLVPAPTVFDALADPQPAATATTPALNRIAVIHRRTVSEGSDKARGAPTIPAQAQPNRTTLGCLQAPKLCAPAGWGVTFDACPVSLCRRRRHHVQQSEDPHSRADRLVRRHYQADVPQDVR